MFYENLPNKKNLKYKKLKYSIFKGINSDYDENVLPIQYSPLSYNFDYSDGALKDGIGFHKLMFRNSESDIDCYKEIDALPDNIFIDGCWLYTAWTTDWDIYRPFLILYSVTGEIYYNRLHSILTEVTKIEGLKFTEKPIVTTCKIDGEDTLLFMSKADGMYTWTFPSSVRKIDNAPAVSSMCVHNNRLYATTFGEKRGIIFGDDINPINLRSNSRMIEISDEFGKCNKVLSFEGYLYIFRDFNIAKLVDYVNRDDYSLSQLYVSNGRIYENTVTICGDKIFYLASDGIYKFNGTSAERLNFSLNKMFENVDNSDAVAGFCNGYYYLSCRLDYNDDIKVDGELGAKVNANNALLKINVSTGDVVLMRGHNVIGIFVINDIYKSEVCALTYESTTYRYLGILDNSGMFFNEPITKVWNSPFTDFDYPDKKKLIKEIYIETKQDIILEVVTEKGKKNIPVKGKNCSQTIKVNICAKKFAINFKSTKNDNYITNPQVLVGFYD